MYLTRLSVERYKCFAQREDLEIRPLTLLIGRNSSGKSVLARLPILLRHALSGQAVAPLALEVDGVEFGGSFLDLVHGRFRHGSVGVGFRFEDEHGAPFDYWVEVQHVDERKLQLITKLAIDFNTYGTLNLEWSGTGDPARPEYVGGFGTKCGSWFEDADGDAPYYINRTTMDSRCSTRPGELPAMLAKIEEML